MQKNWTAYQVRQLRQVLGDTQAEFAARLGVTREAVSMWERGERRPNRWICQMLDELDAEKAGQAKGA